MLLSGKESYKPIHILVDREEFSVDREQFSVDREQFSVDREQFLVHICELTAGSSW